MNSNPQAIAIGNPSVTMLINVEMFGILNEMPATIAKTAVIENRPEMTYQPVIWLALV